MPKLPFAKKSLGQHWLTDPDSLQSVCDAAQVTPVDAVLEIGPGLGTLTQLLVAQAGRVIAVEYDGTLAMELPKRVKASNLEVVHEDILQFNLSNLPPNYVVVANIPYYLTSNLIRTLSETSNPPLRVALLIQKEVAERAAARPGAMSVLGITAQYYWEVTLGRLVPAALFIPPPKVDSRVLVLVRRPMPLFPEVDTRTYFRIVKAGFAQRRKTLLNSLSGGLRLSRADTESLLLRAGISPASRAQTLSLEEWHKIYTSFLSQA